MKAFAVPIFLFALPFTVYSQTTLPTVIVKAPAPVRLPPKSSSFQNKDPGPRMSLSEALGQLITGSISYADGAGRVSQVGLRGLNPKDTLITLEGIPLNDPASFGNGVDLSQLPTGDFQGIEIDTRDGLQGSGSTGGAISLTPLQTKKNEIQAEAVAGSRETVQGNSHITQVHQGISLAAFISGLSTGGGKKLNPLHGNIQRDDHQNKSGIAKIVWRTKPEAQVYATSFGSQSILGEDTFDNGLPVASSMTSLSRRLLGVIGTKLKSPDNKLKHHVYVGITRNQTKRQDMGQLSTLYLGQLLHSAYILKVQLKDHKLKLGGTLSQEDAKMVATPATAFTPQRSLGAIHGQHQWYFSKKSYLKWGIRNDYTRHFGHYPTYSIGYHHQWAGFSAEPTYRKNFTYPNLYQLYGPTSAWYQSNPDLSPEVSHQVEVPLGLENFNKSLKLEVTPFIIATKNVIEWRQHEIKGSYYNSSKLKSQGIETLLSMTINPTWKAQFRYGYLDTRIDKKLAFKRPRHRVRIQTTFIPFKALEIQGHIRHTGSQIDWGNKKLPPFTIIDLNATYTLAESDKHYKAQIFSRLENLLDKSYEETYGFLRPRRGIFLGVRVHHG